MTAALAIAPPRAVLINLATGEERAVPRNPNEPSWEVEAEFDRSKIPGLSHQPQQFIATSNFELEYEIETMVVTPLELQELEAFRKFCLSLTVPRRNGLDEGSGGLPRVLFVWPNYCTITCFVTSLGEKTKRQNRNGSVVESTIKMKLEEVRDVRLTSEDARRVGLVRATLPGGQQSDD